MKEASTKVTVAKMVIIINSFGCQGKQWITVELQDPFCDQAIVKMRKAMFTFAKIQSHLDLHYLLLAICTTVAPVKCMLVTTVALGSVSDALILLSPSMIIFSEH